MILDTLNLKTASFVLNLEGVPCISSISTNTTILPLTEELTKTPSKYKGGAFLDTKYSFWYVMSVVDSFRYGTLLPGVQVDISKKEFTFSSINLSDSEISDNISNREILSENPIKNSDVVLTTSSSRTLADIEEESEQDANFIQEMNFPSPGSSPDFGSYITQLQSAYKDILAAKSNRGILNVSNIDSGDGRPLGQRGQDIGYDLGTMYILGMTHPGKTFGGFSSGFTLGGTIDSGTGPIGKVLGIRDFTGLTGPSGATNGLIGGISGSFTGGYFALLVGEVGPTGGAGATSYVAGATIESSIFSGAVGGTAKIGYIHNLNDYAISGAKASILDIISPLVHLAPIGITVGNTGGAGTLVEGAHQIREYDQNSVTIIERLDEFTSRHDRHDLVSGFSSGAGNTYTYKVDPFLDAVYTNTIRLSANTGQTGGASELQELAYYMTHELPAKRTEFDLHVQSLMQVGSEIDTLYKLSEWGIPETFKRLYEQ